MTGATSAGAQMRPTTTGFARSLRHRMGTSGCHSSAVLPGEGWSGRVSCHEQCFQTWAAEREPLCNPSLLPLGASWSCLPLCSLPDRGLWHSAKRQCVQMPCTSALPIFQRKKSPLCAINKHIWFSKRFSLKAFLSDHCLVFTEGLTFLQRGSRCLERICSCSEWKLQDTWP